MCRRASLAPALARAALVLLAAPMAAAAQLPVHVVTSIPPLAMLANELGGGRVLVRSILPAGADPHTFELKPSDAAAAARADVVVMLGSSIDDWLEDSLRGRDEASVVLLDAEAAGHASGAHDGSHRDPHCWLDPLWVRDHAITPIYRALAAADPDAAARYGAAARTMIENMADLDDDIRTIFLRASTRSFLAWHPAWGRFADRFGLHSVATLGDGEGREPSLRAMISAARAGRAAGVRAVLVEPQIDSRQPRVLADELGVALVTVDPIGDASGSNPSSYQNLMMWNVVAFARALGVEKEDDDRQEDEKSEPVSAAPASPAAP